MYIIGHNNILLYKWRHVENPKFNELATTDERILCISFINSFCLLYDNNDNNNIFR